MHSCPSMYGDRCGHVYVTADGFALVLFCVLSVYVCCVGIHVAGVTATTCTLQFVLHGYVPM